MLMRLSAEVPNATSALAASFVIHWMVADLSFLYMTEGAVEITGAVKSSVEGVVPKAVLLRVSPLPVASVEPTS